MPSGTNGKSNPHGVILNRLGEAIVPVPKWNRGASGPWSSLTSAGVTIDEDNILELDVVVACIRVLAESIASLPLELFDYDRILDEMTPAIDDPLYDLVRWAPNPEWTAYERTFNTVADACMRGYGASQVLRSVKGGPLELWPLEARYLRAGRAPDDGRLVYLYNCYSALGGKTASPVLLEADEVLLTKVFSHGGLLGNSIVRMSAESFGSAKAADDFSAEFFTNGSIHSGMIEIPDELSDEAYARLKKDWKDSHTGKGNRHRAPILEGGAKFNPLALTNQESQLLETQKFKRSTIAGLFRVPAHLINDLEKATYSNIEHTDLGFVKHSLRPWLTNIEQRLQLTLLTANQRKSRFFSHDLTDLLRGDFPTRMEGYSKAVAAGIMNPNEIRRKEKMNPYVGGDVYLVQGALRDITQPAPVTAPSVTPSIPTKNNLDPLGLLQ